MRCERTERMRGIERVANSKEEGTIYENGRAKRMLGLGERLRGSCCRGAGVDCGCDVQAGAAGRREAVALWHSKDEVGSQVAEERSIVQAQYGKNADTDSKVVEM
jgi:hypothetical protein